VLGVRRARHEVSRPAHRRILGRYGFRHVLLWNALLCGVVLTVYGLFQPGTPPWVIALTILVGSIFPSLQFTAINSIAYADIDQADVARATSLASTIQQLSLGMGITIAGIVLHQVAVLRGHQGIERLDFLPTFIVMAVFSVASMALFARLAQDAAANVSRHRVAEAPAAPIEESSPSAPVSAKLPGAIAAAIKPSP
jgi:hypothetical protein